MSSVNQTKAIVSTDLTKMIMLIKMMHILSDTDKLIRVDETSYKIILRAEDRINRFLKDILNRNIIDDLTYKNLFSSGSSLCTLYGLPKIQNEGVPLRPIMDAYNSPNWKLAKYVVSLLLDFTVNQYSLKKSYEFYNIIPKIGLDEFMVSLMLSHVLLMFPWMKRYR